MTFRGGLEADVVVDDAGVWVGAFEESAEAFHVGFDEVLGDVVEELCGDSAGACGGWSVADGGVYAGAIAVGEALEVDGAFVVDVGIRG